MSIDAVAEGLFSVAISSQDIEFFSDDYHKTSLAIQSIRYERLLKLETKHLNLLSEALYLCETIDAKIWKKILQEVEQEKIKNIERIADEKKRPITEFNLQEQVHLMNIMIKKVYIRMDSLLKRLNSIIDDYWIAKKKKEFFNKLYTRIVSIDIEHEFIVGNLEDVIRKCKENYNKVLAPNLAPDFTLPERPIHFDVNSLEKPKLKRSNSFLPTFFYKVNSKKPKTEETKKVKKALNSIEEENSGIEKNIPQKNFSCSDYYSNNLELYDYETTDFVDSKSNSILDLKIHI